MAKLEEGKVSIHGKTRKIVKNPVTGYESIANIGGRKGKAKYVHHLKAEAVLGRTLKHNEEVHHVDGDPSNNENSNLVICPNHAYHMMLHRRQRAMDSTGNPLSIRCEYCGNHGAEKERSNRPQSGWHYECKRKYEKAAYARRKSNG
jgi:hypothetical protein